MVLDAMAVCILDGLKLVQFFVHSGCPDFV